MSDEKKKGGKTCGMLPSTIHFDVAKDIPGGRFPPKGSTCRVWPWGSIIHRIEETGKHIELPELADLEKNGSLVRFDHKKRSKEAKSTVA